MPLAFVLACAGLGFAAAHRIAAHTVRHSALISVTPQGVNFGPIAEGGTFERTLRLRNPSSRPLQLADVTTSCGCTTTQAPATIPAHGSAPLTVRFDSHGRLAGIVHEDVFVSLAGQKGDAVVVPITGTVSRAVALSSETLSLRGAPGASAALTLTRLDGKPLTASAVHVPASLRARIVSASPAVLRVTVQRMGPSIAGVHEEQVMLRLNHPLLPTLTVPVSWTVTSRYRLVPPSVNFGTVPPGAALARRWRAPSPSLAPICPACASCPHRPAGLPKCRRPLRRLPF